MSSSPLVTAVIPAFNAESLIGEAIASIQAQTIEDWELIVVDDGSADQTLAAARQAAGDDRRIRLIRFDRNEGISIASNAGFDAARGEFIARLDSDDRALPTRFAVQVDAFRESRRLAAAGSHARVFGEGVPDGSVAYCTLGDADLKARLFEGFNTLSGGTLMVRRSFVREHRIRFDDDAGSAEDLDYAVSVMIAGGQLANVDQVLTEHRNHSGNFTKTREDLARPGLRKFRCRVLSVWYPSLAARDIDLIVAMWERFDPPFTDSFLDTMRAVDRLVVANVMDFGQNTSIVPGVVVDRLAYLANHYRDHLDASAIQAARSYVSPAVRTMLEQTGL